MDSRPSSPETARRLGAQRVRGGRHVRKYLRCQKRPGREGQLFNRPRAVSCAVERRRMHRPTVRHEVDERKNVRGKQAPTLDSANPFAQRCHKGSIQEHANVHWAGNGRYDDIHRDCTERQRQFNVQVLAPPINIPTPPRSCGASPRRGSGRSCEGAVSAVDANLELCARTAPMDAARPTT
jgi:hypothetical protein